MPAINNNEPMDEIFVRLNRIIEEQAAIIKRLANKLELLEIGGGGSGNASIEDYQEGKEYTRNVLVVDPNEETVYRVIENYTSVDLATDKSTGKLKIVGFESQIVTFDHLPSQAELDQLPEDVLVAIYSPSDTPYRPIDSE
jgi:hypothetical protein